MQQISSQWTFCSKRIFPLIWFGFLGVMEAVLLLTRNARGGTPLFAFLFPVFMALVGIFVMKKLVWDLADQVWDDGDSLVVRFGSEQERIALADIVNVSYSNMTSPARVTLTLRAAGRFGSEVSFAAPVTLVPFGRSQAILDLIQRVDAARRAWQ